MIEIKKEDNAFIAKNGNEICGKCLFSLSDNLVIIEDVICDDRNIYDGLVRSTINFAQLSGINLVKLEKLGPLLELEQYFDNNIAEIFKILNHKKCCE